MKCYKKHDINLENIQKDDKGIQEPLMNISPQPNLIITDEISLKQFIKFLKSLKQHYEHNNYLLDDFSPILILLSYYNDDICTNPTIRTYASKILTNIIHNSSSNIIDHLVELEFHLYLISICPAYKTLPLIEELILQSQPLAHIFIEMGIINHLLDAKFHQNAHLSKQALYCFSSFSKYPEISENLFQFLPTLLQIIFSPTAHNTIFSNGLISLSDFTEQYLNWAIFVFQFPNFYQCLINNAPKNPKAISKFLYYTLKKNKEIIKYLKKTNLEIANAIFEFLLRRLQIKVGSNLHSDELIYILFCLSKIVIKIRNFSLYFYENHLELILFPLLTNLELEYKSKTEVYRCIFSFALKSNLEGLMAFVTDGLFNMIQDVVESESFAIFDEVISLLHKIQSEFEENESLEEWREWLYESDFTDLLSSLVQSYPDIGFVLSRKEDLSYEYLAHIALDSYMSI